MHSFLQYMFCYMLSIGVGLWSLIKYCIYVRKVFPVTSVGVGVYSIIKPFICVWKACSNMCSVVRSLLVWVCNETTMLQVRMGSLTRHLF